VYPETETEANGNEMLSKYPAIDGEFACSRREIKAYCISSTDLPHILFIDVHNDEVFKFSTTQFAGNNNDSAMLLHLYDLPLNESFESLSNVNLFPDKLSDMKGREISLALFNYMPYTIWKEVVS